MGWSDAARTRGARPWSAIWRWLATYASAGLTCVRDITPEVQANIMRDYRRHFGPIVSGHFEEALEAAVAAARQRAEIDRSGGSEAPEEGSA